MNQKIKKLLFKPVIIILFLVGFYNKGNTQNPYFELTKNMEIFMELYKQIDVFYVDETQPGELVKIAIDGMLKSLDPYTVFIPESDMEDYRFMTTGQYGGIGAVIRKRGDYTMVIEPYENFPAQKADLRAGDIIKEIDGKSIKDLSTEEVSSRLKGQQGTEVMLTIERKGEELEKTLSREEIKVESVPYYGMIDDETGYIKLTSFTQTAANDVRAAFEKLKEQGMTKLVFDLRNNGGGLLRESIRIVNMFVDKGEEVVSTKGRIREANSVYTATEEPIDREIPIAVLVNENSASASEIVSGALQDLDRGIVVGRTTYGKGLVQQTKDLDYNTKLKLTIAKYYTPSGRCIQKLNYTHRPGQNAEEIPDSLIQTFKTRNGRPVSDGRGVEPDITVPRKRYSRLSATLVVDDIVFDFATEFHDKNPESPDMRSFRFTEEMYTDFKAYVKTREFDYKTASQEEFKEMKKIAEREGYYALAEEEFNRLIEKLEPDEERDLEMFKSELMYIIRDELITRYHFQTGRIVNKLDDDDYIVAAREVLDDVKMYAGILDGSVVPPKPEEDEDPEGVEELDLIED